MNKLIFLERKRNNLKTYHMAALISAVCLLGVLYLLAALPRLDPAEKDMELFLSYDTLAAMINTLSLAVFTILFAVMSSRYIVEEYSGKQAILLLSYPVERGKIFGAKLCLIFTYTAASMALCAAAVFGVFFLTESIVPFCADRLTPSAAAGIFIQLLINSLTAGLLGIVSLWFGFRRKSVTTTVVAAVICAVVVCQISAAALSFRPAAVMVLAASAVCAGCALNNMFGQVEKMEV